MRAAAVILGAAAVLLGGVACGIAPTGVIERAPAPVIEVPPPSKTIYLLKNGELTMEPADVGSASVESLLRALFAASTQQLGELDTALHGFAFDGIEDSLNPIQRDEVKLPRTSTLTVYVKGEGTLSRTAMAQIVCTAQQDTAVQEVRIVLRNGDRAPRTERGLTCGKLR
ncbi:hypothetical protein OUY22_19865 [Nonomuraea sp. MCN248]|uniref:GerMN domain-containing protein n=1 Tax=Nonomuraea corallina TaxID=2989783 RepID=A0ABT4SEP8_9ACTN|nr:hypothetical protein [Nonomuraea corallina]MDA0635683.1 hypothetical protein [Nonomuraea corallina]